MTQSGMVRIDGLTKRYAGAATPAVRDLSIEIPPGALFTLLGSSGCGKSTTLRCIAGLERPDAGEIWIGDRLVYSSRRRTHVPTYRRRLGMVFQSYAIWPHMTVRQNVAYPLGNLPRRVRPTRTEADERVQQVLRLVGLAELIDRQAPLLSGGEQQRVALARALVTDPEVLLLDEPLSNLDAQLREQMRIELRDLQQRLGLTMVYVTHDQDEAFSLSDTMAVMSKGEIVELDHPREVYRSARTAFGAEFLGISTRLPGRVTATKDGAHDVDTPVGTIACWCRDELREGDTVTVYVRPEEIRLDIRGEDAGTWLGTGVLARVAFLGDTIDWWLQVDGIELRGRSLARDPADVDPSTYLREGRRFRFGVGVARCVRMGSDAVPADDGTVDRDDVHAH